MLFYSSCSRLIFGTQALGFKGMPKHKRPAFSLIGLKKYGAVTFLEFIASDTLNNDDATILVMLMQTETVS